METKYTKRDIKILVRTIWRDMRLTYTNKEIKLYISGYINAYIEIGRLNEELKSYAFVVLLDLISEK